MFRLRILAFIIDYMILMLLFALINIGFMLDQYMGTNIMTSWLTMVYFLSVLIALVGFVVKDIFNGKSLGKRIVKIKVVDKTGQKPFWWKLILRNITILIWYIEALLLLLGKARLGDKIAGTKVILEWDAGTCN